MNNFQFDITDYLQKFSAYCSAQGVRDDKLPRQLVKGIFEPESLFPYGQLVMESAGIPIELSLEEVVLTVLSSGRRSEFVHNRLYEYLRDFTIKYANDHNADYVVKEFFPDGSPQQAEACIMRPKPTSIGKRKLRNGRLDVDSSQRVVGGILSRLGRSRRS